MSTEPDNGGPVRRSSIRRTVFELFGVTCLVAAGAMVSEVLGMLVLGITLLWVAWSSSR